MTEFENMFQDDDTGEAFVKRSGVEAVTDPEKDLLPTGFTFEKAAQMLPDPNNMDGPLLPGNRISPWATATRDTAYKMLTALRPLVPGAILSIEEGEHDPHFKLSHPQLHIGAKMDGRYARSNAGLLASYIARSTAFLDGKIKQFPEPHLKAAADELIRELNRDGE